MIRICTCVALLIATISVHAAPRVHETKHYRVHVDEREADDRDHVNAEDAGRMLEALHTDLAKHFGASPRTTPERKLILKLAANQERWVQVLRKDRCHVFREAGGYYCPGSRTAYLYRQPSDHYTRQLMLHEATHQFHWLAVLDNNRRSPNWYGEGIAEYFGMHTWDGKTLRTGIVPTISLEDYPGKAMQQWAASKKDFVALAQRHGKAERALSWAMVHFLMTEHRERFLAFTRRLDKAEPAKKAWETAFGGVTVNWRKGFEDHLSKHQQPWRVVWTHWRATGEDTLRGVAEANGIAVLKATPPYLRIEATRDLHQGKAKGMAGVVYAFRDAKNFRLVQRIRNDIRTIAYRDGRWRGMRYHTRDKPPKPSNGGGLTADSDVFELRRSDGRLTIHVNGASIVDIKLPADDAGAAATKVGLNVDSTGADFRWSLSERPVKADR